MLNIILDSLYNSETVGTSFLPRRPVKLSCAGVSLVAVGNAQDSLVMQAPRALGLGAVSPLRMQAFPPHGVPPHRALWSSRGLKFRDNNFCCSVLFH